MNILNIINLVNYILDKEWSGRVVTPTQFNDMLPFVNEELFMEEFKKLTNISIQSGELKTREMISLIDDSLLSPFKKIHSEIGTGVIALPDDYKKKLSLKLTWSERPASIGHLEWVSEYEFQRRQSIITRKDPFQYPFGLVREPSVIWLPHKNATADLAYLRQPATPYVDWAVSNASGETILLESDWYIYHSASNGNLSVRSDGVVLHNDVEYHNPPAAGFSENSTSVDPEYAIEYYIMFVNRILEKAGLRIENDRVAQYSEMQQRKGE